jgi:hypothetical protein
MTLVAASLEEKYFETRDNFIREFEKASTPLDSLAEQTSTPSMKKTSMPLLNLRNN